MKKVRIFPISPQRRSSQIIFRKKRKSAKMSILAKLAIFAFFSAKGDSAKPFFGKMKSAKMSILAKLSILHFSFSRKRRSANPFSGKRGEVRKCRFCENRRTARPVGNKEAIFLIARHVREIHEAPCQERDPRAGPGRGRITPPWGRCHRRGCNPRAGLGGEKRPRNFGAPNSQVWWRPTRASGAGLVY